MLFFIEIGEVKSAIKRGDSATVLASLAGGMNINSQDTVSGMTLLMRAVSFGQENIVKLLLNHGANVNMKDNTGSTPLIAACEQVRPCEGLVVYDDCTLERFFRTSLG